MHVYSGDFDESSGAMLESVTYWVYKTILHLYDRLEHEKGMCELCTCNMGPVQCVQYLRDFTLFHASSAS